MLGKGRILTDELQTLCNLLTLHNSSRNSAIHFTIVSCEISIHNTNLYWETQVG